MKSKQINFVKNSPLGQVSKAGLPVVPNDSLLAAADHDITTGELLPIHTFLKVLDNTA